MKSTAEILHQIILKKPSLVRTSLQVNSRDSKN